MVAGGAHSLDGRCLSERTGRQSVLFSLYFTWYPQVASCSIILFLSVKRVDSLAVCVLCVFPGVVWERSIHDWQAACQVSTQNATSRTIKERSLSHRPKQVPEKKGKEPPGRKRGNMLAMAGTILQKLRMIPQFSPRKRTSLGRPSKMASSVSDPALTIIF